jgi:hypothetical protein
MFGEKIINKKRSNIFIGIGVVVLLGIIAGGYCWWAGTQEHNVGRNEKSVDTRNETTVNHNTQNTTSYILIKPVVTEADRNRLEVLKTKFNYKYDEFNGIGWYTNKNQTAANSFNRKLLKVLVNSSGYAYLEDQYYGDDWIFHTRVKVIINDKIYESADIPTYDENNNEFNGSGSVWEEISYTTNRDNGIIKAIAESDDSAIKVRFVGRQSISDFTLANVDRQAIKDAYELSELIKKVNADTEK